MKTGKETEEEQKRNRIRLEKTEEDRKRNR